MVDTEKLHQLQQAVLRVIEADGIEAAEEKYLSSSMDLSTRQLAREIFGNLEQDLSTGEWRFRHA